MATNNALNQHPVTVLLSTLTASSSATISFTSFVSSLYSDYIIQIRNILPQTDNTILRMLASTDNGATYLAANYLWTQGFNTSGGVAGANGSGADSSFQIQNAMDNVVPANFNFQFFNLNDASNPPFYLSEGNIIDNSGTVMSALRGGGCFASATQINAIRFQMSSGNITSGTFRLYGVISS